MVSKAIKKIKHQTARVIVKQRMRRKKISAEIDKKRRKRLSSFLLIMAAVLLIIPGFLCLRHKYLADRLSVDEVAENQELFSLANVIYRHYIGYGDYCKKKGVLLQNYPATFFQIYNPQLLAFGKKVRAHGFTPDKVLSKTKKEFAGISEMSIQREFKQLIQKRFQDKNGLPIQTEENLCIFIDENPTLWMEKHAESLSSLKLLTTTESQ